MPYADLTDPQSLNLYGYVGGNPASKADPDGHCTPGQLCGVNQVVQWIAVHIFQVGTGIESTRNQYNQKLQEQTTELGRDAVKQEIRQSGPALGRELAKQAAKDPLRVEARAAKTAEQLLKSVSRSNEAVNATAKNFGTVGRVGGAVAVGISVYNVATAPDGQKLDTAVKEGGGLAGAWTGGITGAEIMAPCGPWCAAGGGIVGAILGGSAGRAAFDNSGPKPKDMNELLDRKLPKP